MMSEDDNEKRRGRIYNNVTQLAKALKRGWYSLMIKQLFFGVTLLGL